MVELLFSSKGQKIPTGTWSKRKGSAAAGARAATPWRQKARTAENERILFPSPASFQMEGKDEAG